MKFGMMSEESLEKMCQCFQSTEEILAFCQTFEEMGAELVFLAKLRDHLPSEADASIRMKAIAMLTIFFRDNIELMRNLIQVCEIKVLSEEQIKKISDRAKEYMKDFDPDLIPE